MELIACHANTDFDAFASMLACRRLYPGAVVALSGSLNRNVRDFYRLHADELDLVEASRIDASTVTRLVVVEASDPARLGDLAAVARRPDVEIVLFDHHAGAAPDWVAPANVVLSEDGALTTTLVGILAERELHVTALEATVFALGIHEDTGSLTYPTTTIRDAEALAWCLRHGARQDVVASSLHAPLGGAERALLDALLASARTVSEHGMEILVAAVSWPTYVDGVSNLAHKLVDVTDCRCLVCLVEMDERVVVVVRSRAAEFDAAQLAAAIGGGGHRQAASAIVHGTLADAVRAVEAALPASVARPPAARDIMSRPPRFVLERDTVAHAMALCQRHRQSGILVGTPEELAGHVTREDLDKAIGHGLSHAPVGAVVGTTVPTCAPGTPLPELRLLVTASPAGRIAVVDGGEVIGVVARSDVLRAMGERGEEEPEASPELELGERLLALPGLEPVFEAIQALAGGHEGVFLVGGTVRDILLDEPHFDLDIAVEGDGIAFGHALARALRGRAVPHDRFGTAIVVWEGGRVDVATTRTEFYDEPAALPSVEQASLRQDLYRRDFTINAMAVSLRGADFGHLVDFFGGLADLEHGVVRVLHGLSFIDDPTRIFRAVRYESRYAFRMEAHTVSLARACIEMGLVGQLSPARVRDELVLLLCEERAVDGLARLGELGLTGVIHPHLVVDDDLLELLARVDGLRSRLAPDAEAWPFRLAALAHSLPHEELVDWLTELRLRRREADAVIDAVGFAPVLLRRLEDVVEPADARRLLEPHDPHGVVLALALARPGSRAAGWIERYAGELRDIRLELTGRELAALGLRESPAVGEVLEELLRRKVNGELDGWGAELEAARSLVAAVPGDARTRG